jgi:hypothetical protein
MIGRNTNGGRVMMSIPLIGAAAGRDDGLGVSVGDAVGDVDALGESDGDGEADGVGVGGPSSVKVAHGLGGSVTHIWCFPG